jgi:hypothetical protein
MTPEEQIQLLADRAAISDVVHRYATALDTRDWDLYRSIFTDEIEMNYGSTGGVPERMKADDWVDRWRAQFAGFDATQHLSANHVYDIRGDEVVHLAHARRALPREQRR